MVKIWDQVQMLIIDEISVWTEDQMNKWIIVSIMFD
jgi:hypothetical protein